MDTVGLKVEFLCNMVMEAPPGYQVGQGPLGLRIYGGFTGGTFEGPRLRGDVLPGGGDWLLMRSDGVMTIDVRAMLRTDDGSIIYASYGGRLVIPPHLLETAFNPDTVDNINPSDYYFRTNPVFEVASDSAYAWLNSKIAVGTGRVLRNRIAYSLYLVE